MGDKQLKLKISFNKPGADQELQKDIVEGDTLSSLGIHGAAHPQLTSTDEADYEYHHGRILLASFVLIIFFVMVAWVSVTFVADHEGPLDSGLADTSQLTTEQNPNLTSLKSGDLPVDDSSAITRPTPTRAQVNIYNEQLVGLAKLSPKLVNKEPVGELMSPLSLGDKPITRVFFSTRLLNAIQSEYFHVWYLNGQEEARVPLRVSSQSWRGNSSKYINPAILGDWKVQLENLEGQVQADAAFTVIP